MILQRSSISFLSLAVVSVILVLWIIKCAVMNPMIARETALNQEIDTLETRPKFYIAPASIDNAE